MPINLALFAKLTYLQFLKSKQSGLKFTPRRRVAMLLWYLVIPVHQFLTFICFYLDEVFFPHYREQEIKAPVFIAGNFRSGSSLLQRLMARDRQFTSMNVAEIYIAPTITQRKMWQGIAAIDRVLFRGAGRRFLDTRDKAWLDSIQMHKVGLFTPDEDEGLLITIWSTMFLQFVFPVMEDLPAYDRFDEDLPEKDRQRIMGFYRAIIRRHLYYKGGNCIYLAKSPAHSGRIDSLYEYFPDARIIYLARNPMRLVPSAINFFNYIWTYMGIEDGARRFQQAMFDQIKYWYIYPMQRFKEHTATQYYVLRYEEMVSHLEETVTKIYQWLGLPLTEAYQQVVRSVVEANHTFESDNVYTLKQISLSEELIASQFKEVLDLFGFSKKVDFASVKQ